LPSGGENETRQDLVLRQALSAADQLKNHILCSNEILMGIISCDLNGKFIQRLFCNKKRFFCIFFDPEN
jgi:hypothetical protein